MKRYMKKAAAAVCAAALILNIAACGGAESPAEGSQPGPAQEETKKEKPALEAVYQAVKDAYGDDYLPSMAIDGDMLESMYGISSDLYDEFIGEVPMISAQADAFIAVRGKEGKGDEIRGILEDYKENLITGAMMYPMNLPLAQSAQVVQEGDDVFLIMTGTNEAYGQAETEDEMLQIAEDQIAIGVKAVEDCYE